MLEPYLLVEEERRGTSMFTALRTGTNKLRVEMGRWKKPKMEPLAERICMACMREEVEDEMHFLLSCNCYADLREILFHEIRVESGGKWMIGNLTQESQWKVLMGGTQDKFEGRICELVKKFIRNAYKRRDRQ